MKHIPSALSLFWAVSISSQYLQGRLVDTKNIPIAFVNIIAMTVDSVFISGIVSDEDGTFKVMAENDIASLEISYTDSHKAVLYVSDENDLGVIILKKEIIDLCPI